MLKRDLKTDWEGYKSKALKTLKIKPIHILIFPKIREEFKEVRF